MFSCHLPASTSRISPWPRRSAPSRNCASRPAAILEGQPPLEKIIAVNEKAANLRHSPRHDQVSGRTLRGTGFASRSSLRESAAHAALLDCAQSFSPCVEDAACDTALARSRRHGIFVRVAPGNLTCDLPAARARSASPPMSLSLPILTRPCSPLAAFPAHRHSYWQRGRTIGIAPRGSFVCQTI